MKLVPRLELAGAGLLALPEPEHEGFITRGYEGAHDLGRWWDAALRLQEAIGLTLPGRAERSHLENWLIARMPRVLLRFAQ